MSAHIGDTVCTRKEVLLNTLTLIFVSALASDPSAQTVVADPAAKVPNAAPAAPVAATVAAAPNASVEYVVEGGVVMAIMGDHREAVDIEGPIIAIHREATLLYVARGARGVTVYDVTEALSPRRLRTVNVSGQATGFHVIDGQIWVITVSRSAVPLDDAAPAVTAKSAPAPIGARLPPSRPVKRHVPSNLELRRVMPGTVEIDSGAADGVRVGDNFAIFRSKSVDEAGAEGFTGEELVTVAVVVAVKENSALAETGRSAVVEPSDYARPTEAQADADKYPPRVANVGELSMVLRPIINAGTPLGAGVLADLEAAYWGPAYFADFRIQPLGLGSTVDGSIISTAALVEGGYDTRALAVGLGAGVSWVNGDADHMLQNLFGSTSASDTGGTASSPTVVQSQQTHTAFTISQLVRLGSRDGVKLSLRNLLILHRNSETDRQGFIYGGTTGLLSIPLSSRSDFFLEGGGGVMGYWYAGVGVSTWIVGNGSPGSWKLSVSAGGAGIFGSKLTTTTYPAENGQPAYSYSYNQSIDVAGPMVSFGVTRRFSL